MSTKKLILATVMILVLAGVGVGGWLLLHPASTDSQINDAANSVDNEINKVNPNNFSDFQESDMQYSDQGTSSTSSTSASAEIDKATASVDQQTSGANPSQDFADFSNIN